MVSPVHCRVCWQSKSPLAARCDRCGDVDLFDAVRAIVGLGTLAALVGGVVIWATLHLCA